MGAQTQLMGVLSCMESVQKQLFWSEGRLDTARILCSEGPIRALSVGCDKMGTAMWWWIYTKLLLSWFSWLILVHRGILRWRTWNPETGVSVTRWAHFQCQDTVLEATVDVHCQKHVRISPHEGWWEFACMQLNQGRLVKLRPSVKHVNVEFIHNLYRSCD